MKKQNHLWKKIAVAASILLVLSIGYQLIKPIDGLKKNIPQVVVSDSASTQINIPNIKENAIVNSDKNSIIKKEATSILEKQIEADKTVVVADEIKNEEPVLKSTSNLNGYVESEVYEKSIKDSKENKKGLIRSLVYK